MEIDLSGSYRFDVTPEQAALIESFGYPEGTEFVLIDGAELWAEPESVVEIIETLITVDRDLCRSLWNALRAYRVTA